MKLLTGSALALALLFLPTPSTATSCSADCEEAIGCYGGCEISPTECGSLCYSSGCNITCSEIGPEILSCSTSQETECGNGQGGPSGPPKEVRWTPDGEPAAWAVVRYQTDEVNPITVGAVEVLAASTEAYGVRAVDRLRENQNKQLQRRVEKAKEKQQIALKPLAVARERTHFSVKPLTAACAKASLSFGDALFPVTLETYAGFYFKAGIDQSGQVTSVETLYTDTPELEGDFVAYLETNLRLTITRAPEGTKLPGTIYGFVKASPKGSVSHILGATVLSE